MQQTNVKRQSNVVLMLGQRCIQWYNIQPAERQVIVLTGDPLNLRPFDKQIQVYLIVGLQKRISKI